LFRIQFAQKFRQKYEKKPQGSSKTFSFDSFFHCETGHSGMERFEQIGALQSELGRLRSVGKKVGFVPTMGALHEGHLSLLKSAKKQCDIVVVSIFVNPTQFNDPSDFEKYPRNLDLDQQRLMERGCDVLFTPSREEMYPKEHKEVYDFGRLSEVLEAAYRPGHFDGMATIVKRLLTVVEPDVAFFGEKDFQQLSIVRSLVKEERLNVDIVGCPIIREDSGLAMSSRNERLTPSEKETAVALSQTLFAMAEQVGVKSPLELEQWGREQLKNAYSLRLEYLAVVDADTFKGISSWEETQNPLALVAAYVGEIRLIDNLKLSTVNKNSEALSDT
jgi:pantoate--beta-alanine ligase